MKKIRNLICGKLYIKSISMLLSFILIFTSTVYANDENLDIVSLGAVLMDYKTGRVLYGKDEHEPLAMASTTKIMTLIIAIEDGNLNDTVTVSKRASQAPKVKMYLEEGEEIKLEYLLYALMLESSNDAAIAIAEHIHGSVEEFCEVMTKKAHELGAVNTVFETPNGLDSENPNHMSTAYDMALIARYALDNQKAIEIMNTKNITFKSDTKSYGFTNKNRLISTYNGANGGKTGYTNKAGQCFVGMAKQGDMQLISVVLGSGWGETGKERKWIDTKILLDYGFSNYEYETIIDGRIEIGELEVLNSKVLSIPLYIEDKLILPLNEDEKNNITLKNDYVKTLEAPIKQNQKIGVTKVMLYEDEVIGEYDIIADGSAEIFDFISVTERILENWFNLGSKSKFDVELRELIN